MSQHNSNAAYEAARRDAAWLERTDRGRIVISGSDRASYLHALLTNDIAALQPGHGVYSAYLTPQGRMVSDMWVYELGDVILMTVPLQTKDTVLARLDQFLFSEDVQLGDVTDTFSEVAVVGPRAEDIVRDLIGGDPSGTIAMVAADGATRVSCNGEPAIVMRVFDLGESGWSLLVPTAQKEKMIAALRGHGTPELDADAADTLRIEGGIPRFGPDMDEETIPLEAGIESRAISLTKGCYVGQEVIVRVLHRGHGRVARRLVGLELHPDDAARSEGDNPVGGETVPPAVPPAGAVVRTAERDIGHVTSARWSPQLERPIALAYVHRDFTAPGTLVTVDGQRAAVVALPFVKR